MGDRPFAVAHGGRLRDALRRRGEAYRRMVAELSAPAYVRGLHGRRAHPPDRADALLWLGRGDPQPARTDPEAVFGFLIEATSRCRNARGPAGADAGRSQPPS